MPSQATPAGSFPARAPQASQSVGMATSLAAHADELRRRLGPVGVWLSLLGSRSADEERARVAEIEDLGYGAFWFGEAPSTKEAFAHAGILLAATRRIVVATGIANIHARDATAMNNGANALAEAYPGRFVLGMGVSHAPLVRARGHDYGRPLTAMREYLDAMDAARYAAPTAPEGLPRVLAALRPRMLQLARDRADGAHPYLVTSRHTAQARRTIGDAPFLAPEQGVVLETDPDRARAIARKHLSGYLQLPNYTNSWRAEGFDDGDLADGGSDRLVDALIAWGDPQAVAARVREHLAAGADHVAVQPVTTDVDRALDELRALAPALRSKG
jgi:probable F420-dependent oxidoreductase